MSAEIRYVEINAQATGLAVLNELTPFSETATSLFRESERLEESEKWEEELSELLLEPLPLESELDSEFSSEALVDSKFTSWLTKSFKPELLPLED